jgi:hypothetical protein
MVRVLLVLSLMLTLPASAFAYSYGDPNKEEIAETYKEISAKLQQTPEDWNGAYQAFLSRKQEIALEFGNATVQTLEDNFVRKQKELVLHNYKAVLVLNIDRRLDNAEKQFEDYAKAKLLLAKARGTLNVLAPHISESASKTAYAAFDKALNALGNPGLFGVGAVPANKSEFLQQTNLIRSTLHPFFPLKKQQSAPAGQPAAPKPSGKPTAKQAESAKPAPAAAVPKHSDQAQVKADSPSPQAAAPSARTTASQPAPQPTGSGTPVSAPAAVPPSSTAQAQPAVPEQTNAAAQPESTEAKPVDTVQPAAKQPAQSKVNPFITAFVVGGLLLVVGVSFWFAKRKGWL